MGCAYPFLLVSILCCALANAAPVGNGNCRTYCSMGFLCFTRCGGMYAFTDKRNEAPTEAPIAYADEVHQYKNTNELSSLYDDLIGSN